MSTAVSAMRLVLLHPCPAHGAVAGEACWLITTGDGVARPAVCGPRVAGSRNVRTMVARASVEPALSTTEHKSSDLGDAEPHQLRANRRKLHSHLGAPQT